MTFTNDPFNKISVIKKDGRVAVLTEKELFSRSSDIKPVFLGKRIVFSLTRNELNRVRDDYKGQCA